ncbi:hypothetical protein HG1285_14114 [Hydrogenivirga sp. 128-5-R1-1]|nr:hypothetical protein HG1285_14114 [Hydrogenivirga sp. 128-5-R1-1]
MRIDKHMAEEKDRREEHEEEEFGELIKYTFAGFAGGLGLGWFLDKLGFQQNPIGEWLVRTLAGEGESILEGFFAVKKRLSGATSSLAQAYGWGKLIGMTVPWWIDLFSRLLGVNVYGWEGFYIPYFYAMSDQLGANVSGFVYMYRQEKSFGRAVKRYLKNPVMLTSLLVILIVPLGLLIARLLGFSPTTNFFVALETIAANLCWLPPLVGMWVEKKRHRRTSD